MVKFSHGIWPVCNFSSHNGLRPPDIPSPAVNTHLCFLMQPCWHAHTGWHSSHYGLDPHHIFCVQAHVRQIHDDSCSQCSRVSHCNSMNNLWIPVNSHRPLCDIADWNLNSPFRDWNMSVCPAGIEQADTWWTVADQCDPGWGDSVNMHVHGYISTFLSARKLGNIFIFPWLKPGGPLILNTYRSEVTQKKNRVMVKKSKLFVWLHSLI